MKTLKVLTGVLPIITLIGIGVFYFVMMPREIWQFNAFDPSDRLPQVSNNFIQERYPDAFVLDVDIEWDGYEVYLSNGVEIEFRFSGSASSIDIDSSSYSDRNEGSSSQETEVPISSLSSWMMEYINERYPNAQINRAEEDYDGIEVYLSNGLRIDFDNDGTIEVESDND